MLVYASPSGRARVEEEPVAYRRYRVHVNFHGLRAGQIAEIDDDDPGWSRFIERRWLVREATPYEDDETVSVSEAAQILDAVPNRARFGIPLTGKDGDGWDRGGMQPDDDA